MKTKTEIDGQHPSSNYLVVVDPEEPSTWHLRVRNSFGQLDHKLMGDAWAALHEGFRGRKYEGPNQVEAIRKLTELYHQENMRLPGVNNRASQGCVVVRNRADVDGDWIHIVPRGELPNSSAGIVQVLDDKAMNSILASIEMDRKAMGENWPGIYGGKEHFIYDPNQDSAALAWFKDFEKRDDGIWARRDGLTPEGREAIRNKRYKYTSFVADRGDLEHLDGKRYRVKKIETVGFTNLANGKDLLTPITNRAAGAEADVNELGLPEPISANAFIRKGNADDAAGDAVEQWFEALAYILRTCKAKTGLRLAFPAAWGLCKAKNPALYHEAFGSEESARPAESAAEEQSAQAMMTGITNRLQTMSGLDFRWACNFVRAELPQVFNRRFGAAAPARIENADNFAGVQKRAARYFGDLVSREQAAYNISYSQAFSRVSNWERELRRLANYEMTPQEAFESAPALKDKLLNRDKAASAGEIQARAKRLFESLINKEKASMSHLAAYRVVMNRETALCDLVNGKITPEEAFSRQSDLEARIANLYFE